MSKRHVMSCLLLAICTICLVCAPCLPTWAIEDGGSAVVVEDDLLVDAKEGEDSALDEVASSEDGMTETVADSEAIEVVEPEVDANVVAPGDGPEVVEEVSTPGEPVSSVVAVEEVVEDSTTSGEGLVAQAQKSARSISIAKAKVAKVARKTYTGKPIKPTPKVTLDGKTLKRGTDYTFSYRNNTKVGTATIFVKGKGRYGGTKKVTFQIAKAKAGAKVRGPKSAGALKVKGGKLVDRNGKAIQLKGVSTHGLAWFPDYVNDACFKQLRTDWGANVVRLALYTEEYGGYCAGGSKADLLKLVKKGVRLATKNDLYVIVDWHILSDGNPNAHVAEAKKFFANVSATFKGNNNVLYEICNEPNGGTSWAQIKKYANKVIPVMRKNDPDAVILVGTPTWSQEIDKAAASPLKQKNVMYTMHFYAATHKDDLRNRLASCAKAGLPVFVSEFGICDASGNGAIDKASANSWVTTMKSLGISWCMWSLCNKAESASVLQSSCTATSGFRTGDLSTSGKWLLKALNGSLPAGSDASVGATGAAGATSGNGGGTAPASTSKPVSFSSGKLVCKVRQIGSWDAGNGKTCYQYELSITNKGAARSSWNVTVPFSKSIAYANGWNGTFKAKGSKLTVRSMDYNGTLGKGETVTGIGFQVTAKGGLAVKS